MLSALRKSSCSVLRIILVLVSICVSGPAQSQRSRLATEVAIESRVFIDDPQFAEQFSGAQGSVILTGDWNWISGDRDTRILVEPFLRLDTRDSERTYADIREASVIHRYDNWDVLFGVSRVFWGVAESRNVVDVVNQFDTVEDFDQGEKLGQPMVRVGLRTELGRFETYYLPFFREQILPGPAGRLRFDPVVDTNSPSWERGGEEWAGDLAFRYENAFDEFDIGVHAFYGTSRNPAFRLAGSGDRLLPVYQKLLQTGVDVQYTRGSWLLKFEGAALELAKDNFFSGVAGFEYIFFDIQGTGYNLGLIGEYLYDDREVLNLPPQLFDDDIFAGVRVTANDVQDTEFLLGAIVDRNDEAIIASAEFQRRLGSRMLLEIEARYFEANDDVLVQALDHDSHVTLRLTCYF